ncbi:Ureidoglycolate hydrolase [Pacificitalea manganoxidans]|uniref:Ureidoglycolate hydrolase n=1 Tax=Pacificitalea manganoxidans TaxID=1411902 RepID=A0A291LYH9_9RHOB|nr:ureidoglycolate lyase [Pacificitalea manganoxidans]ATI41749.1 Ureidoglycolate hydrolase [Pacificitalea manganoxidans]MAQ47201.1 ureidoglycolate lyase [Actibacterium sp.]MDR6309213.1 ureidoglycolate lyase [Pacificitalea manganoxidans]
MTATRDPLPVRPLTAQDFAPFGDLLDTTGAPDKIINQGLCGRYHDRARIDVDGGRTGLSLFDAQPRTLPYRLEMLERHPLGSQAFLPLHQNPFLVIVAPDANGRPGQPQAFLTEPGQGINLLRGTWHGVLTPLFAPGLFAVVDRIAPEGEDPDANLEEHWLTTPVEVVAAQATALRS